MGSPVVFTGLMLAAVGYAGRVAVQSWKPMLGRLRLFSSPMFSATSKYYKGGFEPKMDKREASLILGISPSTSRIKIGEAHRRIMLINHPDKGGSPYLAAKINEAKEIMNVYGRR